jgi:hypothetical protein
MMDKCASALIRSVFFLEPQGACLASNDFSFEPHATVTQRF